MLGQTNAKIVTGGSQQQGEYFVRVIDYDGTIIDEQWLDDGDEYTLPANPNRTSDGLVFQEWSCSQNIINGKITIDKKNVIIGAIYTTVSGQNEFDIELNQNTGLSVTLKMNGTKDWGDGTSDASTSHTYNDYGNYTIKCNGTTMSSTSSSSGLFNQTYYNNGYNYYVKFVRFATVSVITEYAFRYCYSLKKITMSNTMTILREGAFDTCSMLSCVIFPNNITTMGSGIFSNGYALHDIILPKNISSLNSNVFNGTKILQFVEIPPNVTTVGSNCFYGSNVAELQMFNNITNIMDYAFQDCKELKNIILSNNITSLGSRAFYACTGLEKIKMPKKLTTISSECFYYNINILEYDFSEAETIPTLSSMSSLPYENINKLCKIKVPWDLYQDWITATNWNYFENYIDGGIPATINFIKNNTTNIYINKNEITSFPIKWVGPTMPYVCYDSVNNIILFNQQTQITENQNITITINNSSFLNPNKIAINTGVSDLSVKFLIDGIFFDAIEDNGNYYINFIGNNVTIKYFIDGGNDYLNELGTITTTGSDITENITLTAATTQTFVRPNLTSNGTLGGDSFAVLDPTYASAYPYQAVDASDSSYWRGCYTYTVPAYSNRYFIFYNPNYLNVTQINVTYNSSYYANDIKIQGSNDGINYENISSTYSNNTLVLDNDLYFKYYKIEVTPRQSSGYNVNVINFDIVATEKIASV